MGKKMIPLLLAACLMLTACGTKKAETPEFEFQAETDGGNHRGDGRRGLSGVRSKNEHEGGRRKPPSFNVKNFFAGQGTFFAAAASKGCKPNMKGRVSL